MVLSPDPASLVAGKEIANALNQALESPLKEVGNYIADKVRYLRYKSLLKIVAAAKAEAEARGMLLQMPPLKFFVPFCEGASLEEESSEEKSEGDANLTDLQEMWKHLLFQASENYDSRHQVFIRILREIANDQVEFLRRMVDGCRATTHSRFSTIHYEDSPLFDTDDIIRICSEARSLIDTEVAHLVVECLEGPGVTFYHVCTGRGHAYINAEETEYIFENDWYYSTAREASHALLESLGLIRPFALNFGYFDNERYIEARGVRLTELGVGFIEKCTDLGKGFQFKSKIETDIISGRVNRTPST
jgi:hypothetical protein